MEVDKNRMCGEGCVCVCKCGRPWNSLQNYKGIPCPTPSGGDIKIVIHTLREEEEEDKEGRRAATPVPSTFAPAAAVLRSLDASVVLDGFLCLWVCVVVALICLPPLLVFLHVSLKSRWESGQRGERRGGDDDVVG